MNPIKSTTLSQEVNPGFSCEGLNFDCFAGILFILFGEWEAM
jgi:hypothetical protein